MIRRGPALWLCLRFPALALEVFSASDKQPFGTDGKRPLAVVENHTLVLASAAARAQGVEAGLSPATARALCGELQLLERQPRREREALQQLAHWAYRYTPEVACADDNSLLLEVGSCRRLHGGLLPLLAGLQQGLAERGHRVLTALAHTRKAAWLLAQHAAPPLTPNERDDLDDDALGSALAALPTALLPLEPRLLSALQQMGIATLGELAALPRPALGKRFGAPFIRYLEQLLGFHPDPQPSFQPAPHFARGLNFINGVHDRQMLLFPMKRLLHSLADYLDARQLHCRALHWHLFDAHQVQAELTLELSRARNQWQGLLELSRIRLEQLPLSGPVFALSLSSEHFLEARPIAFDLFAGDDEEPASALLDRLRARLGEDALLQLEAQPSHWPEQAWRPRAVAAGSAGSAPTDGGPRPLWLLPRPLPLRSRETPQLLRGPERIDNHWWQEPAASRDYYVGRDSRQRLGWFFRDRASGRWFLHGLFG